MIIENIRSAIIATGIPAETVVSKARRRFLNELEQKFDIDFAGSRAPWDCDSSPIGLYHQDGWRLIAKFVGNSSCLMFPSGAREMWRFDNGDELLKILEETVGFEFYVFDSAMTYLICYNHHDFIVGWGAAQRWINGLR